MRVTVSWRALAVLGTATILLALPSPAAAEPARVSSHAMLFTCCMPYAQKERIFSESKAMGARYVRVDVQLSTIFESFGRPVSRPNWKQLDEVIELSRRHGLPVLGILLSPPAYVTTCSERWPNPTRCPVRDEAEFNRLVGEVAAHARGTIDHWEVLNEPDGAWTYDGTPEQYAQMLSAAHRGSGRARPRLAVLGGLMWPTRHRLGSSASSRPRARGGGQVRRGQPPPSWQRCGASGRAGALARPAAQTRIRRPGLGDGARLPRRPGLPARSAYRDGEAAQGAYLTESVLALADAGADQVFVTLRDALDGAWASEGLVHIKETAGYPAHRKPAFDAVRRLVDQWDWAGAWRAAAAREKQLAQPSAIRAGTADRRSLNLRRPRRAARVASMRRLASRLRRLGASQREGIRRGVRARGTRLVDRHDRVADRHAAVTRGPGQGRPPVAHPRRRPVERPVTPPLAAPPLARRA